MATVRTVLPRKGLILPQHGAAYEADLDTNFTIIDNLLQDASDVQTSLLAAGTIQAWLQDNGVSGVVSGFALSTSSSLTPGLSTGVLYAQGKRYTSDSPAPGAAPGSSTSYLFMNSTTGFYYNLTGSPASPGDAFLGKVTTSSNRVTAVTNATRIYGMVDLTAPAAGAFSVPHYLGRTPVGAAIYMTSAGAIWFQVATRFDAANLYLVASGANLTASIQVW